MQFARLAMTSVSASSGVTLFTATSKTIVRTMDVIVAGSSGSIYVKVNDTGSDVTNPVWYFALANTGTYTTYPSSVGAGLANSVNYTAQWRGGLVMNPGDYLYVYASGTTIYNIIVCGVTGV